MCSLYLTFIWIKENGQDMFQIITKMHAIIDNWNAFPKLLGLKMKYSGVFGEFGVESCTNYIEGGLIFEWGVKVLSFAFQGRVDHSLIVKLPMTKKGCISKWRLLWSIVVYTWKYTPFIHLFIAYNHYNDFLQAGDKKI